jgi:hypothetical protein
MKSNANDLSALVSKFRISVSDTGKNIKTDSKSKKIEKKEKKETIKIPPVIQKKEENNDDDDFFSSYEDGFEEF